MGSTRSVCAWLVVLSLATLVAAGFEDYYEYGADYDYATDWKEGDCLTGEDGVSRVNGTVCDIEVSGADTIVSYSGGVTGVFKYTGECQNGRPGYKRDDVPGQASAMWLFYSRYWGDWDFCNATVLDDSCVIGYGGEGYGESRPQDILDGDWFVLKDFVANQTAEEDFVNAPMLSVKCILAHENTASGTCTDGIMNGEETGVDCGGSCPPCVSMAEQQAAVEALKEKLRKEWEEEERESAMSGVAQVAIIFIALVGCAIVCGGPILYCIRALRSGKSYAKLPIVSRPAHNL